jgi:cobalamin biosynthesis Mg chelatase CobN
MAVLTALCFAGQTVATTTAWGAAGTTSLSSAEKAALDKQVQEAVEKAKTGQSTGAQGAAGAASTSQGLGSSEAFSNLTQKSEETEEPTTKTTSSSATTSSGISTSVLVPIFIAGALLLGGIAFLIVRDARNVAPAGDGLSGGSSRDQAARQRKRRAKAKAARRQRKRNR